jgi:hypothetical protein
MHHSLIFALHPTAPLLVAREIPVSILVLLSLHAEDAEVLKGIAQDGYVLIQFDYNLPHSMHKTRVVVLV